MANTIKSLLAAGAAATTTITDVFVYGVRITEDKPSAVSLNVFITKKSRTDWYTLCNHYIQKLQRDSVSLRPTINIHLHHLLRRFTSHVLTNVVCLHPTSGRFLCLDLAVEHVPYCLFNGQLRSTTARAQQLIAVTKRLYTDSIARRRRWP